MLCQSCYEGSQRLTDAVILRSGATKNLAVEPCLGEVVQRPNPLQILHGVYPERSRRVQNDVDQIPRDSLCALRQLRANGPFPFVVSDLL